MLRRIPESYKSIFGFCSFEPGMMLFESYNAFASRNPNPESDIRSDKEQLLKAVETFEVNLKLLIGRGIRAGNWRGEKIALCCFIREGIKVTKAFLGPDDTDANQLRNVCAQLKVVNQLRAEFHCRTLTVEQLKNLKEDDLVTILLRYNKHFLGSLFAIIIFKPSRLVCSSAIPATCTLGF